MRVGRPFMLPLTLGSFSRKPFCPVGLFMFRIVMQSSLEYPDELSLAVGKGGLYYGLRKVSLRDCRRVCIGLDRRSRKQSPSGQN